MCTVNLPRAPQPEVAGKKEIAVPKKFHHYSNKGQTENINLYWLGSPLMMLAANAFPAKSAKAHYFFLAKPKL